MWRNGLDAGDCWPAVDDDEDADSEEPPTPAAAAMLAPANRNMSRRVTLMSPMRV
jgi:hypothetical protein